MKFRFVLDSLLISLVISTISGCVITIGPFEKEEAKGEDNMSRRCA